MRILRLLIGRPPRTMTELIKALDVTRTAITEQINDLVAIGYVEQTQEKCLGRGRPRFLFSASKLAMRNLFEGTQDIICPAIWQAIRKLVGKEALEEIRREVADNLAEFYDKQLSGKTPQQRLREFVDILVCQGKLAELKEKKDFLEMHVLSCSFHSMIEETGSVCRIHLLAFQKLLGHSASVSLISHRTQENQHCCVFLIKKNDKESGYLDRGIDI